MPRPRSAPQISTLADEIAADIRGRKLGPGDAYLSAADTARRFKVSGTAANRALQLLEKRCVLHRRQRVGAVIADPTVGVVQDSQLQRVHLIVQENYLRTEGLLSDGVLIGLQETLPGAELQFNFLPDRDEVSYVQTLVTEALKSRLRGGFVLLRSSVGTQRIVENSGLPAVVHGQLHPSISRIAQIDRDQYQIGQILTDYLLRQRCSRMLVLLRETVSSGDHRFLDAVMSTCLDAGLGLDRLTIRCFPADSEAIAAGVREVMTKRKTGILCRNEQLAEAALAGVADSTSSTNCVAAVADVYRSDSRRFVSAATVVSPEEFGRQTGRILLQRLQHEATEPARISIPVELCIPGGLQ
ncbi:MAG: hypothetical protein R3C59_08420 [Planctomycetaceae bacterium]